jgi:hypothetical protein
MKNVLLIFIFVFLLNLSPKTAFAGNMQSDSPRQYGAVPVSALANYNMEDSTSSSKANEGTNNRSDSESFGSALFPYFFYALSIIGLLIVLSVDTSGNARSKRKSKLSDSVNNRLKS